MASPTQRTWVWVKPGSWWWTGRPGVLQSMGSPSQTRLSDWNELNWSGRVAFGGVFPGVGVRLSVHRVLLTPRLACASLPFFPRPPSHTWPSLNIRYRGSCCSPGPAVWSLYSIGPAVWCPPSHVWSPTRAPALPSAPEGYVLTSSLRRRTSKSHLQGRKGIVLCTDVLLVNKNGVTDVRGLLGDCGGNGCSGRILGNLCTHTDE